MVDFCSEVLTVYLKEVLPSYPGRLGQHLLSMKNKQYVDYGFHLDKCYHNPDVCRDGVT